MQIPETSPAENPSSSATAGRSGKSPRSRLEPVWAFAAILLIILLMAGIRFRLRDLPLERDEGEYAYAGQLILQGVPPYEFAYNMKLPGTYAAYAAVMAFFGQSVTGIHLGVILVNAACILLVFLITKALFDSTAAVVAGATFGLFSIRPQLLGLAGHATHFVTLCALISIYMLLKACGTRRYALFFASGLFAGLAFLMKQPGLLFAIFAGLYLLWREWRGGPLATLAKKLAIFVSAVILPYLLTCLILFRAGVFQKFWFWTFSYARVYGSELGAREGLHQFANRMELQKENAGIIWLLILFAMAAFLWNRKLRENSLFILGLLGFSFCAVSVGFFYRGHYFIVLYPVLAMLAGIGVSAISDLLRRNSLPKSVAAAPVFLFFLAFANALYAERAVYFTESTHEAAREIYGINPFPEALVVADYIQRNSTPGTRVAVIGSEPEIYFYSHRMSATGYIYTYPLVEEQAYASVMQTEFIGEVESANPEYIVYILIERSWLRRAHSDEHIFQWADAYTRDRYSLVGVADGGGNHDIYRWGADAQNYRPRRPEVVLVYKRNPQ